MALANATLTASDAVIFTANSANAFSTASVGAVIFKNHDASARTVTLHARPSAEAVADENMLLEISIPAGESYTFSEKLLLSNTDVLSAFADTTSVVAVTISYLNI